jgi:hypothetical protein
MNISLNLQRFCQYVLALEVERALRDFAEQPPPAARPFTFHEPLDPNLDVSIVMPVWNPDPKQLDRALRSIASQKFDGIRYEFVVSDDASTGNVAERMVAKSGISNVRYHRHEANIGGLPNFNWSVASARAGWIHMLHQDDWVENGFYSALLRGCAAATDTGLRFCRTFLRNDNTGQTGLMFDEAPAAGVLSAFLERQTVSQRIQFAGAIFSRSAVEAVGGFEAEIGAACDWEFWARIASRFQVYYEPRQLATYVLHEASWSSRGAAGFADAKAFAKYRLVLQRMLTFVPPERRRATAQGFMQNMLARIIDVAQRNKKAGSPQSSIPVGKALFVACEETGILADVEKVLFGI